MSGPVGGGPRRIGQKIAALLLGLLCAAVLLEVGVRLVGVSFLGLQGLRDFLVLSHPGAYRILCLGDSMTAMTYPRDLQEILESQAPGRKFAVIDAGRPATNSRQTLAALPTLLADYHPDMVVVMMGANDWGETLRFGQVRADQQGPLRSVRLVRFLRFLAAHKKPPTELESRPRVVAGITAIASYVPDDITRISPLVNHARGLMQHGKLDIAIAEFTKALAVSPGDSYALLGLGECHALLGDNPRASTLFVKASAGLFKEAARTGRTGPRYAALVHLGWSHRQDRRYDLAIADFQRAIGLKPRDSLPYRELAFTYLQLGQPRSATWYFEKNAELDSGLGDADLLLGRHYLLVRDYLKAKQVFRRVLVTDPANIQANGSLASCYAALGRPALSEQYLARANALRDDLYVAETQANYRQLRRLVLGGGAKLVCVQYPRRSLAALRRLFDDASGVLFVDNEAPFNQALREAPASDYFIDFYADDFGHCTPQGYHLLAQDIAGVILKEIRGQ